MGGATHGVEEEIGRDFGDRAAGAVDNDAVTFGVNENAAVVEEPADGDRPAGKGEELERELAPLVGLADPFHLAGGRCHAAAVSISSRIASRVCS